MDQPFHARLKLYEGSEIYNARHRAAHAFTHLVSFRGPFPGMRLELLHADGNTALVAFAADLEHLHFNVLAY